MRDYGLVYSQFWSNSDMQALPDTAKLLAIYLLSSEHTNMLGCFRLPAAYAASDLHWTSEKLLDAFDQLHAIDFLTYDAPCGWVCIHKFLKWDTLKNPNQAKAAMKTFRALSAGMPLRKLLVDALLTYGTYFCPADRAEIQAAAPQPSETLPEPLPNPFKSLPEPLPNPSQTLSEAIVNSSELGKKQLFILNPNPIESLSKAFRNPEPEPTPEPTPTPKPTPANLSSKQTSTISQVPVPTSSSATAGTDTHDPPTTEESTQSDLLELRSSDPSQAEEAGPELRVVREIFGYYLNATGRNPVTYTLTPARKRKGQARLREALHMMGGNISQAEDLLKAAIDTLTDSDWHMGRDPKTNGKRYCDWETNLFGSTERLQKWLEIAQQTTEEGKQHG